MVEYSSHKRVQDGRGNTYIVAIIIIVWRRCYWMSFSRRRWTPFDCLYFWVPVALDPGIWQRNFKLLSLVVFGFILLEVDFRPKSITENLKLHRQKTGSSSKQWILEMVLNSDVAVKKIRTWWTKVIEVKPGQKCGCSSASAWEVSTVMKSLYETANQTSLSTCIAGWQT